MKAAMSIFQHPMKSTLFSWVRTLPACPDLQRERSVPWVRASSVPRFSKAASAPWYALFQPAAFL